MYLIFRRFTRERDSSVKYAPLAMSLNLQWKALKCLPWQKNTPNGIGLEADRVGGIMIEGWTWWKVTLKNEDNKLFSILPSESNDYDTMDRKQLQMAKCTLRDRAYLSSLKKLVLRVAAVPSSIFSSTVRGDSYCNLDILPVTEKDK